MKLQNIYGIRAIVEAIENGISIEKVLIQKEKFNTNIKEIILLCKNNNIPIQFVPEEKFNSLKNKNHQGVIALVSSIEYQTLENIVTQTYLEAKHPFILILDGITDVRNFGAIARTALSAGVHALVVEHKGHAQINDDAIKTSAGALIQLPVCREISLLQTIKNLKLHGLKIIACTEKASLSMYQCNLSGPVAIIMGNEEKGIRSSLLKESDHLVHIPMFGNLNSLNVSVATGIILYECIRQRNNF
ncbi:MAG: 23S rRNA (guanosine(2251)-2'-O)-methyltransferase RlmB [Bacteroidales bacterium]|nr:23S rRNA (guanosine(2251)-2'-O)-methyltransferase RlmB [Bacteroidales bacterium]